MPHGLQIVEERKVLEFVIFPEFLTLYIEPILEPFDQHETRTNVKYQYCTRKKCH